MTPPFPPSVGFCAAFCGGGAVALLLRRAAASRGVPLLLAWGYGISLGIIALSMVGCAVLGFTWTFPRVTCGAVALATAAAALLAFAPAGSAPRRKAQESGDAVSRLIAGCIIILCIAALLDAMSLPLCAWDGLLTWGYKAKMLFVERSFPRQYFTDATKDFTHPDYPLLIPLSEAYLYLGLGKVDEGWVKVIFPLFYAGLLAVFFDFASAFASRRTALFSTLLLGTVPAVFAHASTGYADLPLAFFSAAGTFSLLIWMAGGAGGRLIAASVFTALAAGTKNEGVALALINLLLLLLFLCAAGAERRRRRAVLLAAFLAPAACVVAPWALYLRLLGVGQEFLHNARAAVNPENLARLPLILGAMGSEFLAVSRWNILWPCLAAALCVRFKRCCSFPANCLCAALALQMVLYAAVFVITPRDLGWHLATALDRLVLHTVPTAMALLCCLVIERTGRNDASGDP